MRREVILRGTESYFNTQDHRAASFIADIGKAEQRNQLLLRVNIIVSPVRSTYGGYYGLVVVTPPRPRPQTLHRSHDNLKNPYRIASIFYM